MLPQIVLALALGSAHVDATGIQEFNEKVTEYLRLRQEITRQLPPERMFDDPGEMLHERARLRAAIRRERDDARRGDIFTPNAAVAFRRIIARTLAASPVDPMDLSQWLSGDQMPGAKRPKANGRYDWRLGAWMWPRLLRELPQLPRQLEYRIVDDDLVLVDVRASLVVDVLEDALEVDEE